VICTRIIKEDDRHCNVLVRPVIRLHDGLQKDHHMTKSSNAEHLHTSLDRGLTRIT